MEQKVKVNKVLALEKGTSKTGKDWQKLQFVGETFGEYPKQICFTAWNESVIDLIAPERVFNVHFDIESREYNSKYYTDVKVWKAELIEDNTQQSAIDAEITKPEKIDLEENNNSDEILPF